MFTKIANFFKGADQVVASVEAVPTLTMNIVEKPLASDAAPSVEGAPKLRRGRPLTEEAKRAHDAVADALTEAPKTRAAILSGITDESLRAYADGNWQNVIARLMTQNKAKLASEHGRGRNVSYSKAA